MNETPRDDDIAGIEVSISKHKALIDENVELHSQLDRLTQQLDETTKGFAQESIRLNDQLAMLNRELEKSRKERDLFAGYAVEVKSRAESLGVFMEDRADGVEQEITQSAEAIRRFISDQVEGLVSRLVSDAKTVRRLSDDALSASRTDVVARLQDSPLSSLSASAVRLGPPAAI